jgi:hypothetical protein
VDNHFWDLHSRPSFLPNGGHKPSSPPGMSLARSEADDHRLPDIHDTVGSHGLTAAPQQLSTRPTPTVQCVNPSALARDVRDHQILGPTEQPSRQPAAPTEESNLHLQEIDSDLLKVMQNARMLHNATTETKSQLDAMKAEKEREEENFRRQFDDFKRCCPDATTFIVSTTCCQTLVCRRCFGEFDSESDDHIVKDFCCDSSRQCFIEGCRGVRSYRAITERRQLDLPPLSSEAR